MVDHLGAHRAEPEPGEPAGTTGTDDLHVGIRRCPDQFVGRGASGRLDNYLWARAAKRGERLIGHLLRHLLLEIGFLSVPIRLGHRRRAPRVHGVLANRENGQRHAAHPSLQRGPLQGALRVGGSIHSYHNS